MWWLLLLPISLAGPIEQNLSVGQILNVTLTPRTTVENPMENGLPEWMYVSNGRLVGIPTAKDIGPLTLKMKSPSNAERLLKIRVTEDESNPCGTHDTTWVEVVYNMPNGKIQDRVQAALKMAETLKVGIDTVRVLDFDYSRTYRAVENIAPVHDGSFAVIKPHCDGESEAIDLATDDMDKLLDEEEEGDNLVEVTVTQGRVLTRKQRGQDEDVLPGIDFQTNEPEPITKPPVKTTTQRTTRQSPDNPPVRLNSLSGFSCVAGVLCESHVPEQTFKDAEEGDTYKLQLSVTLLDEGDNFLFYKDHKLQGVPLKAGEYQFRLDARDQRGQMASAPFSVSVKPASAHNHLITFHMDLAKNSDIEANPEMLTDFVRQLTQITKTKADSVTIRDITKEGDKTIVSWSNNSLPYKTCSEKGIETMMAQMLTKKRNMTNRQFVVAMTSRFNLRKVEYTLLENCIKEADLGTTMPTVEAASEGSIPWIPILVAALVVVLLVICCLVMCSKKNTKKGTKPSEYVGKGLPVVFPEEVADEMELTNAATPMLTKEERPPLKVSSTHENPLYKPPPPLVASSPRVGSASGSLPPTQRMPPPYVPP